MRLDFKNRSRKFKIGLIMMGVSLLFFVLLVVFPLLDIDSTTKITLSSISFILAEVLFYGGGFLLGKEMFSKYKAYLNPVNWFRKRKVEEQLQKINK